jgi:hypothetical protein
MFVLNLSWQFSEITTYTIWFHAKYVLLGDGTNVTKNNENFVLNPPPAI